MCPSQRLIELHCLVIGKAEGQMGRENTCHTLHPTKRVCYSAHAHKPGNGHARPIGLILRRPAFSEVVAKNFHTSCMNALLSSAEACWRVGLSSPRGANMCAQKRRSISVIMLPDVSRHSSRQGLLSPEISLKIKSHNQRLSSAHQQASLLVEENEGGVAS